MDYFGDNGTLIILVDEKSVDGNGTLDILWTAWMSTLLWIRQRRSEVISILFVEK